MNVGGIPLAEHRHGFQMVVLPLLALTLFLGYMALGRHRD